MGYVSLQTLVLCVTRNLIILSYFKKYNIIIIEYGHPVMPSNIGSYLFFLTLFHICYPSSVPLPLLPFPASGNHHSILYLRVQLLGWFFFSFFETKSLCRPDCSVAVGSQLTVTSACWVQAILLPQPPK